MTASLGVPAASAGNIANLQARARALAYRIQNLGTREDAMAQHYDTAMIVLRQSRKAVARARLEEAKASTSVRKAKSALLDEAIATYEQSGASAMSGSSNTIKGANKALLSAEYENNLVSAQKGALDRYKLATVQDQAAENAVQARERQLRHTVQQLAADKGAVLRLVSSLNQAMKSDKGRLAVLVARQQATELRQAQAKLAAEKAAQQVASSPAPTTATGHTGNAAPVQGPTLTNRPAPPKPTGPPSGPPPGPPPGAPPASGAGATAVFWAEKELGVPYLWGGASPAGFDCSGLVMWSYAHAGVSLPHSAIIQYADTVHIPMSELQPGDLVFPVGLYHVGMYIGGGRVIQAPHTGATVNIVPLNYGGMFQLAGRVR